MLRLDVPVLLELRSTLVGLRAHEIGGVLELGAHARLTVPAKPFSAVTVIVEVPDWPGADAVLTRPSRSKSGLEGIAANHAVISLVTSSEPKPVTWSYPVPALKPMDVVPLGQFFVPTVQLTLFVPEVTS